jgi:hypothetical protein
MGRCLTGLHFANSLSKARILAHPIRRRAAISIRAVPTRRPSAGRSSRSSRRVTPGHWVARHLHTASTLMASRPRLQNVKLPMN